MDPNENNTRPEKQLVSPQRRTRRKSFGKRFRLCLLYFRSPVSTLPLAVACLLGSSATRTGRNFCRPEPVYAAQCCQPASRQQGAVLFLRLRLLWSLVQPVWLKSTVACVGSMVAPLAALPAGAFVSGQAVFHGRELLAELPLVSELPFSRVGPVLGHGGGLGLPFSRGFHPGRCCSEGEPSLRSWGSEV